ncbi:DUF6404 family protein [Klebsiella michiganensis]|uniref:DUF6404 family protein n=1 Tax=Klebsiella michiganensis TaxID=1134687 RepID=UPI001560DB51|nr:DUF6404 family protein [Klebsiella michiganensis]NRG24045.1 hypothetical protein [Klebsiella michiganensis]
MDFEQKKQRAVAIMDSKKMWRSNYAPPLLRLAWKAGLKIPPLPFASFWQITLLMGGWFGPAWGISMWFFNWQDTGMLPAVATTMSIFSGIFFGVSMAAFHLWRKKVNNLPDWDNLE